MFLASCGETATTTTQLTEVPEPQPITCKLAADLAAVTEVETTIEENDGAWNIAEEVNTTLEVGKAFIATIRQIGIDVSIVAATDPWAVYLETAVATVSGDLQEVADQRGRTLEVVLVPTSYNTLIDRCINLTQPAANG